MKGVIIINKLGKCSKCGSNDVKINGVKYHCNDCGHDGFVTEWIFGILGVLLND